MTFFREFDSMEEMQRFLAEQTRLANESLSEEQKAITYGDYWVRTDYEFLIFGYINTLDELDESSRRLGADEEEIAYERAMIADAHARGYMYGKAYSVVEPDGEWGSTHRVSMQKVSKQTFDRMRELGWTLEGWR